MFSQLNFFWGSESTKKYILLPFSFTCIGYKVKKKNACDFVETIKLVPPAPAVQNLLLTELALWFLDSEIKR